MSSVPASPPCLMPSQQAGREFVMRGLQGEVIMLNLLRFRETADYSSAPDLAPDSPIRGAEAFDRYIRHTLPFLHQSGESSCSSVRVARSSSVLSMRGGIWPCWCARAVRRRSWPSRKIKNAWPVGLGHRTAAVEDSRLLPLSQISLPDGNRSA